jgi:hypothetical protein
MQWDVAKLVDAVTLVNSVHLSGKHTSLHVR